MEEQRRVSDVFRQRLRETRTARNLTQGDLGALMREAGHPTIDNVAVLRIEKGERGISLDEAFAFASVLDAVPAQMFTPPGDELVAVTRNFYDLDGRDMRAWLRYGHAFMFAEGDLPEELSQDRAMARMVAAAVALVDAMRNDDKAGKVDAYQTIEAAVDVERERREAAEREKAEREKAESRWQVSGSPPGRARTAA